MGGISMKMTFRWYGKDDPVKLDYIAQIKTTTQLGPQPPLNVPAFLSLKGQIERFKSTHVKIQK